VCLTSAACPAGAAIELVDGELLFGKMRFLPLRVMNVGNSLLLVQVNLLFQGTGMS
jgi:hypothetical protein